ncbi:FAS1-like dehydratase domain-containing protein [Alkalihalobacterium alkalicellulosilyticum]|uniref:FAS1-like dehydratase domain-containing protein n=1 Tax=Alkalihalobacterium alkalicellulosilyticum TaxID=1912214 RepID=UPI000998CA27|nr:MaoC family dehydratase N-terminal domain-containing protein [Bacillus alkalicellulosilyticus]
MIDEKWLKQTTKPFTLKVTREMVSTYASAILLEDEQYFDIAVATHLGYDDIPAPATFPMMFWQHIEIPWLATQRVIHGKQEFSYVTPIVANQIYQAVITLQQFSYKQTKSGLMQVSEHELIISTNEKVIASAISTLLIMEEGED